MAHQDISFGSFSVDETLELFTEETNDLQFVWQRSERVRAALGMQLTPSKSNFLDIPSVISEDRRSFSPDILSPNIPPNPPTSPVEDGTAEKRKLANLPASRKLNVNATPFVPINSSFPLEKNHLVATPEAKANHSGAVDSTVTNKAARQLDFSGGDRSGTKVEGACDAKPSSPSTVSPQTSGQTTGDSRSSTEHLGHNNSNSRTGVCTPEQATADSGTANEALGHNSRTAIQTSGEVTADSRTASDYDRTPEGAPDLPSSPSIVNPLSTVNSSQNGVCSDAPATSPTHTGTRMDTKALSNSQSPVSTKPIISCTESVDSNSKELAQSPSNPNPDPCPPVSSSTHEHKHKPLSSASSLSSQEAPPTTEQVKQDGNTQPLISSHEDTPTHETTPSQDLSQSSLSECSRQSASESLTSPKLPPEGTPWPGIEKPASTGGGAASTGGGAVPTTSGGSATTPALSATSSTSSISGTASAGSVTGSAKTVVKSWASIVSKSAPDSSSQASQSSSSVPQTQPPSSSIPAQARTSSQQGPSEKNGKEGVAAVSQGKTNGRSVRSVGGGDGGMVPDKGSVAQLKMLGEQLQDWRVSHRNRCIQPRGLVNQGNWCYMHAPLQALLSIPSFLSLFQALNPNPPLAKGASPTPITDALIQFVHEFKSYPRHSAAPPSNAVGGPAHTRKKRHATDLLSGDPLRPDYVYSMLHSIRSSLSHRGRQEDAEEFLGCVLNGLHEELVSAFKALQGQLSTQQATVSEENSAARSSPEGEEAPVSQSKEGEGEGEGQEWEQVGPKNKSTITRQTLFSESAITEIFGGQLRSALHRQGAKESATLEPFFSLQLDIQSEGVTSVREALDALTAKETVHISEADAYKRLSLARLPPVLIFHLKRFLFTSSGSQKLLKHIYYHTEMELPKDLLAPAIKSKLSQVQRTYRLWAVVYHHGKTATGGHYTSDVFHSGYSGWVRVDDSLLKPIPDEFVLKPGARVIDKNAYLLFYRRLDTINP